jgi:pimeloyl-ACP methyl ester carboxylesterase
VALAGSLPVLDEFEHRFIDVADGVTIHVGDAGPPDGPPVMLVHGFPQNWWQWRALIGPLARDGYRVLCPDLRGAGWSSAPGGGYWKNDMAPWCRTACRAGPRASSATNGVARSRSS